MTTINIQLKKYWLLALLVFLTAFVYSLFSVMKHWHFQSGGFDLGIFDQVVWHYSRFELPVSTTRGGGNILSDHFSPILTVLAPLYWFFKTPGILLISQGILFALAIIPIFLFSRKRLGELPAYLFSIAYASFWGILNAAAFDFHEIAFAVPLIAFAIYFIDNKKWLYYFLAIALLLLVKEDQSVLVVFFGIYLLTLKQFKPAIITLIVGTTWYLLATKVFIPFFAGPGGGFAYWTYTQFGPDFLAAIKTVIKNPLLLIRTLLWPRIKVYVELDIVKTFGGVIFLSPLIVLAIPLILERFLSTHELFWVKEFHYTATISPIVAMASADGLYNLTKWINFGKIKNILIIVVSILIVLINFYYLPRSSQWSFTHPSFYRASYNDQVGYRALKMIPAGVSVVAQDGIIPHLSERQEIYQLKPGAPDTDYIIASSNVSPWPNTDWQEIEKILDAKKSAGWETIFSEYGWIVLRR